MDDYLEHIAESVAEEIITPKPNKPVLSNETPSINYVIEKWTHDSLKMVINAQGDPVWRNYFSKKGKEPYYTDYEY